ncbi:LacI family DNA-binding transcriptional regulator [Defluviitalea saccharophila]|uniref:LacI family DNA-binding transcriptional regulator n=1 Tax=Defluviitalea saccharophila TaxID=879970 RepID=A0ABZ2Y0X6_9FIRM|nr:LacI family transcriptional regulator [Candidatus Epulonipiscium sp.]
MAEKKNTDKKDVTIYDIAKLANTSPGTVSRALNNIGYVKEETRLRIEEAAKKLEYIPNRAARTLKTKRTGLILLAIPDMDNPFYIDMIKAIQEVSQYNNYSLILYYTEGKVEQEIKVLKMLHEQLADGMIMVNLNFTKKHLQEIKKISCPLVLSSMGVSEIGGNQTDPFDYIGVDTQKGIYMTTQHLIQQGHTRIGYIGGNKDIVVFRERYRGYSQSLIDGGLTLEDELVFFGEKWVESTGYEAGKYFLSLKQRPTAICAANDIMAIGAIRAFEEAGLHIPKDISIIGMDNIDLTHRLKPKMSSVAIAQAEIGRTAAELIFKRLRKEEQGSPKKIIFQPRLIIRESSILCYEDI